MSESTESKPENGVVPPTEDVAFLREQKQTGRPKDTKFGWLVTVASTVNHAIFFGINLSFGVIFVALLDYFGKKRGETAWIGSLPNGLLSFISPVSGFLTEKYGCRMTTMLGAVVASLGFIISYLATSIEYLYVSYGVLVGAGLGLMFLPSKLVVFHYIYERRALANAVASAGGGIGTVAFSALFHVLLEQYNLRGTFLISGAVVLNGVVCGALFRPVAKKKPTAQTSQSCCTKYCQSLGCAQLVHKTPFYMITVANVLSTLGVFVPYAHLPRLSRDLEFSEPEVTCLIPILSVSSLAGRIFFGWLGDLKSVNVLLLWSFSTIICGVCLLLCPIFKTFPLLVLFAVVFGCFVGVWTGLKTVALESIVGLDNLSKALGIFLFCQGFAAFAGSPLAGWLYDLTGSYDASFYNAGALFVIGGGLLVFQWRFCSHRGSSTLLEVLPEGEASDQTGDPGHIITSEDEHR